jgi:hypothetical protein
MLYIANLAGVDVGKRRRMKRRDFITLLGGAAITLPVGVRAQRGERLRHVAILDGVAENDLEARANLAAFLQELQQLGWSDSRNARFDICWGESDPGRIRKYAADLARYDCPLAATCYHPWRWAGVLSLTEGGGRPSTEATCTSRPKNAKEDRRFEKSLANAASPFLAHCGH